MSQHGKSGQGRIRDASELITFAGAGGKMSAKKSNPAVDVSALESEIDRLVYRLYGLTGEEIKVVKNGK